MAGWHERDKMRTQPEQSVSCRNKLVPFPATGMDVSLHEMKSVVRSSV